MAQNTALAKAMNGEELSDRQTKGALSEALDRLGKEGGRLSKLKENMGNLGDALIYAGETQGTVFVASFAEGYLGEEKMDIGPVDLRLAGGIAASGYGIYNVMTGKGGEHALAVGNGLISTAFSRVGRNAGKALAEKREKKDDKKASEGASAGGQQSGGGSSAAEAPSKPNSIPETRNQEAEGDFGELVRDIFLTPDGDAAEGRRVGRGERVQRHAPSRFIRATVTR